MPDLIGLSENVANTTRVLTIFIGGVVIGGGTLVLLERGAFYRRLHLRTGQRAMWALIVVNIAVLTYISLTLIVRWDQDITWRTYVGLAIFTAKGVFFHFLRATGIEQERRKLFDVQPGGRRAADPPATVAS